MSRYIDADKLVDYFKFAYITDERYKDGKRKSEDEIYAYKVGYNEAIDNITLLAPTADVVEAVRCGECKWWKLSEYNTFGIHICQRFSGVRGEHDFCSRGEKKDE